MIKLAEMEEARPIELHDGVVSTTTDVWNMLSACREGDLDRVAEFVQRCPALRPCQYDYHFRGWRDVPKDWPTKPDSGDLLTAAAVFAANPALANNPEALANAASEGKEAFARLMLRYQPDLARRVEFPGWAVGAKTRELNELLFQHGLNPSDECGIFNGPGFSASNLENCEAVQETPGPWRDLPPPCWQ